MSELDQTIEELEAEVLAELEEAAHDAPKKGAAASEPQKKVKGSTPGGETQDGGEPVVEPDAKKSPTDVAAKGAKEVGADAQQKGEGAPEKMAKLKKVKEEIGYTDAEVRELCHSEDHDCAVVVEHPVWGKGKPLHASHAMPDKNGHVKWYDVQFKHGIEEKVMVEDMEVIEEANHEAMEVPKTKEKMIAAMVDKMNGMPAKELKAQYGDVMSAMMKSAKGPDMEEQLNKLKSEKEEIEEKIKSINVKEDVEALVDGEDLSEEFKEKAATVFEAAVKSRIRSEIERMEESYVVSLDEATSTIKEELSEKVDDYLGYIVEQWMKENELAIERGLKGEIAEDFISGLKQLFEDHYIDVPDEKYDVLEAQAEKISELEEKLNETIDENVEKKKAVESLVRDRAIAEACSDLAETETEKFASLVEDVDFTDVDSFREKLSTLKESYFPKTGGDGSFIIDDDNGETAQDIDTTDTIKSYLSAISRSKSA
jgi:hypothetical protein